jgi:hypothetical protein
VETITGNPEVAKANEITFVDSPRRVQREASGWTAQEGSGHPAFDGGRRRREARS